MCKYAVKFWENIPYLLITLLYGHQGEKLEELWDDEINEKNHQSVSKIVKKYTISSITLLYKHQREKPEGYFLIPSYLKKILSSLLAGENGYYFYGTLLYQVKFDEDTDW